MADSKKIFRDKALEQLSSPEQLDHLLQVVQRKSWVAITALAFLCAAIIAWSALGKIPVTIEGRGILVYPRQVVAFQSPSDGQLTALLVRVGDTVTRGQVIGMINQPDLKQRLQQQRERLEEFEGRNVKLTSLRGQRTELEQKSIKQKRSALQSRIEMAKRTGSVQKRLLKTLEARYDNLLDLKQRNMITDAQLLDGQTSMIQTEEAYQQAMANITDYRSQLQELDIESARLDQQVMETRSDDELEIQEVRYAIERLQEELKTRGQIVSEYNGRLIELTSAIGQIVQPGQRLGALEVEDPKGRLMAVGYYPVGEGKKIDVEDTIAITPSTVQRERYGSIVGRISGISTFPVTVEAVRHVVGNGEIARDLTDGESRIQVFFDLVNDANAASGYRWTSGRGPDTRITAGTTVALRATVEYRRPISYVIPLLRTWSGF